MNRALSMVYCLLAQTDLGRAFSRYSRHSSSLSDNWFFIAVAMAIAALWIALYYWDQFRKEGVPDGGRQSSLFVELCQVHGLTRPERMLLLRAMEDRVQVPQAAVFIQPEILAELALSESAEAGQFRDLFTKLFDGIPSESATNAANLPSNPPL